MPDWVQQLGIDAPSKLSVKGMVEDTTYGLEQSVCAFTTHGSVINATRANVRKTFCIMLFVWVSKYYYFANFQQFTFDYNLMYNMQIYTFCLI